MSLDAGESLAATATTAEHWLLVEVPGSWPRDVSADGALLPPAQEAVTAWLARTPSSRLLFMRRPGRAAIRSLAFVVHASESTTDVRRIELENPGDIARVDFERDGDRTDQQLVLVCGHGTRDACCALLGVAVYSALAARLDGNDELWISSHQGGHRFAANVLVLPAGLQFGRVEPDEAPLVVARALSGRIELDRYRGRTCYTPAAQAAERVVRETLELEGAADLTLTAVEGPLVRFRGRHGSEHAATVDEVVGPSVAASCGVDPEPQKVFTAQFV
ncbi:MAG: hypothetical protein HW413_506 [Thermoleophilia bacterium]|nr:hypothetical protein [Thermoleophilia bacterium]